MKFYILPIIILLSFFSCKTKNEEIVRRTETKLFGDSLKIDYTYIGDTVFQKRTDLKGKGDDGLDNSFDVRSIWKTLKAADLNCDNKIKITKRQLDYIFCLDDLIANTQKQIKNRTEIKWNKDSILKFQMELLQIKNGQRDTVSSNNFFMIYHFIRDLGFIVFDQETQTNVNTIRTENYETNFSGGHIYYLINKEQDTVAKYNLSDWMK
jgi:hypothetical protein